MRSRSLWLAYWSGNDSAKQIELKMVWETDNQGGLWLRDPLPTTEGVILEGEVDLPEDGAAQSEWSGLRIDYTDPIPEQGAAIRIGPAGVTSFALLDPTTGNVTEEESANREWPFGKQVRTRIILRDSVLELYLDDILIQSFSLPGMATGRLGLFGNGIAAQSFRGWTIDWSKYGQPTDE